MGNILVLYFSSDYSAYISEIVGLCVVYMVIKVIKYMLDFIKGIVRLGCD